MARRRPGDASPWPFVGMAGMAAAFFLVMASAPVTPWWGQLGLFVLWLVFLLLACAWWTPRPTWVAWVPVASIATWFAIVMAGAAWWGWAS